jgi:hypothetical protein
MNIVSGSDGGMASLPTPYMVLKNQNSSADPLLVGYESTTDHLTANPATDYSTIWSSQKFSGKRSADAFERAILNVRDGQIRLGNGTVAPTAGFDPMGSSGIRTSGSFYFRSLSFLPTAVAGHAPIWFDEVQNVFKARLPNGTICTLTMTPDN